MRHNNSHVNVQLVASHCLSMTHPPSAQSSYLLRFYGHILILGPNYSYCRQKEAFCSMIRKWTNSVISLNLQIKLFHII